MKYFLAFGWCVKNSGLLIKVESITNIMAPNSNMGVNEFIWLINYYWYIWDKCSHTLQPLILLTSKNDFFKWTDVEQKAFDEIKLVVAHNSLLAYYGFNKQFLIHMNASNLQL